jgi:hypothetical protein
VEGCSVTFAADGTRASRSASTVPPIYVTTASGSATALSATRSSSEATITPLATKADLRPHPTRRQLLHAALGALFPSLQAFRSKSLIGKVTALLCVPALLALNLTLPVAEEPPCDDDCSWTEEKQAAATGDDRDGREEHADEEGTIERIGRALHSPATLQPHEHDASPTHRLQHLRAEATEADAPSPSLAWGEVTRDPLEPLNLGSPAVALQQNPLEEFGVVQSSEAAEEASRRDLHTEAVIEQEAMARERVTRTLTAMQCALGPVFVVTALLGAPLLPFHMTSIYPADGFVSRSRRTRLVLSARRLCRWAILRLSRLPLLHRYSASRAYHPLLPRVRDRHGLDPHDRQRGSRRFAGERARLSRVMIFPRDSALT